MPSMSRWAGSQHAQMGRFKLGRFKLGRIALRSGDEAGYPTGSSTPHLSHLRKNREWKASDETHLPAEPHPPQANAWISSPHEDTSRASDSQAAPRKGPQAARSQHSLEVGLCFRRQAAFGGRTESCEIRISSAC